MQYSATAPMVDTLAKYFTHVPISFPYFMPSGDDSGSFQVTSSHAGDEVVLAFMLAGLFSFRQRHPKREASLAQEMTSDDCKGA